MIIKSMTRKDPSFGQLMNYMDQAANKNGTKIFSRNIYGGYQSSNAVEQEFRSNFDYLPKRKNGNALYHEVIVLEPQPNVSREDQQNALLTLATEYLKRRASDHLAYGRIHFDRDHPHIHLMISANAVRSKTRKRLDRATFNQIQKDLETYVTERLPNIQITPIYNRAQKSQLKLSSQEAEAQHKRGKLSQKQVLSIKLQTMISQSNNKTDFNQQLRKEGFRIYQRGSITGIEPITKGRRYRLKTLGLDSAFKNLEQSSEMATRTLDPRTAQLMAQRTNLTREASRQLNEFERDE